MEQRTLCYLLRVRDDGQTEVCLAPKKKKHVSGWLNAAGGGIKATDASPESGAVREVLEEQNVIVAIESLKDMGEAYFLFPHCEREPMRCFIFTTTEWQGEPSETDEMGQPEWHPINNLPLDRLPPADRFWLPRLLAGERLHAVNWFDEDYYPIHDSLVITLPDI